MVGHVDGGDSRRSERRWAAIGDVRSLRLSMPLVGRCRWGSDGVKLARFHIGLLPPVASGSPDRKTRGN